MQLHMSTALRNKYITFSVKYPQIFMTTVWILDKGVVLLSVWDCATYIVAYSKKTFKFFIYLYFSENIFSMRFGDTSTSDKAYLFLQNLLSTVATLKKLFSHVFQVLCNFIPLQGKTSNSTGAKFLTGRLVLCRLDTCILATLKNRSR